MVVWTYSNVHTLLDLDTDDVTATETEAIIDQAIDLLNLAGDAQANQGDYTFTDLDNMSGVAGSKTVGFTSKQAGAVGEVAKSIYYRDHEPQVGSSIGPLALDPTTPSPEPWDVAERMAMGLVSKTTRDFLVAR